MNKLQLCQRLQKEAGVGGAAISTTVDQTSILGRLVTWIEGAYEDIQSRSPYWEFLRNDFSFNTIIGTANYVKTAIGLEELGSWKDDSFRVYLDTVNDEHWLNCIGWDSLRDYRLIGASTSTTGKPIEFAVKPDKSIQVWPVPDDEYTISGEYYKRAQTMAENTGEPLFPSRFHMVIVWRALMMFAADQEATVLYAHAQKEYKRTLFALENDQLPGVGTWEPLA